MNSKSNIDDIIMCHGDVIYTAGEIRAANTKLREFLKLPNPRSFGYSIEAIRNDRGIKNERHIISCSYAKTIEEANTFLNQDIDNLESYIKKYINLFPGKDLLRYEITLPVQDVTDILCKPPFLYENIFQYLSRLDCNKFYCILHRLGLHTFENENPLVAGVKLRTSINQVNYAKLVEEIIYAD